MSSFLQKNFSFENAASQNNPFNTCSEVKIRTEAPKVGGKNIPDMVIVA